MLHFNEPEITLAKAWIAFRGSEPTRGEPLAELPLAECVDRLGMKVGNWIGPPETTPKFDPDNKLAGFLGPQFVVVEVSQDEAQQPEWRSGFYLLELSPNAVRQRLQKAASRS
jgi:hypothetical protein